MKALIGFAGFGGPEIALREAGFETIGIENDPAIAEVNRFNGGNVITADILMVNPADFIDYDLFHFSPPCPNYSVAKAGGIEGEGDIALARRICEFIRMCRPRYLTLENVWGYRKGLSWLLIWYTLLEEGYGVDAWNLNAVDYGVPQSRRRMIVIARRDGRKPAKPWPTHSKHGDMFAKPWVGWYEAIEDLIPDLPESQFAPWQRDRLPEEWKTFLIPGDNSSNGVIRDAKMPMVTVQTRPPSRCPHRAFILGQGQRSNPKPATEPADTVTGNNNQTGVKALIMDSANSRGKGGKGTIRRESDPVFTMTAMEKTAPPKAFIVDQSNGSADEFGNRGLIIRQEDQPVFTVTDGARCLSVRAALPQGRVVSMTPRALARFQQFPDDFVLPGDGDGEPGLDENIVLLFDPRSLRELACRGIGNAMPPPVMRAVLVSLGLI